MSKTVVQEMIDFVTSDEYNHLYPNVKQEWFNTFLEKEKLQTPIKQGSTQDKLVVLKKYGWDGRIPYEDTITMHSADLLDAMQEYADQFKSEPPYVFNKDVFETAVAYANRIFDFDNTTKKYTNRFVNGWMVAAFSAGAKYVEIYNVQPGDDMQCGVVKNNI